MPCSRQINPKPKLSKSQRIYHIFTPKLKINGRSMQKSLLMKDENPELGRRSSLKREKAEALFYLLLPGDLQGNQFMKKRANKAKLEEPQSIQKKAKGLKRINDTLDEEDKPNYQVLEKKEDNLPAQQKQEGGYRY
ncbi:uncharacterized protein LOC109851513 [Asparagus officinalis]|uniref:uncharacterized protein LOC109851513 n=1 Tax=Asparagus officinalis TaxID=4686 RepID=UPI00098E3723|nr:uncharacterized protein LOC109851513 [Asparagus officinalis]